MKEIPDHVSWRVRDAWLAIPPCWPIQEEPFCHVDCPYFGECYPPEDEDGDMDEWDQYFSDLNKPGE